MIKLIALDIDGTLVGHDLNISARVRDAIARALERGIAVTLATGRGAAPTQIFAAQLHLTTPLVCLQGAQVFDAVNARSLHESRLLPEVVPWIVARAAERDWHVHFETPSMVYMPNSQRPPEVLRSLFRVTAMTHVEDFLTEMPEVPTKFLISVHDPAERDGVAAELHRLLDADGIAIDLMNSHPNFVEGLPPNVSKASGLAWLIDYLCLAVEDVLAIGDNDNDIAMLHWAGTGVAMGNASPGARAVADWVAPSVEEDGAAIAIERYVLA
ncbi:MAG: Cof-type HAD-IIB family hydrolase [Anaerolineales bacterium]